MVKNLQNWSRTAASNVLANTGFTWDEGQLPSTVNNSARTMMTDVKEFFDYTRTSQAWHLADNASATNAWAMTAYYTPYNASGDATGLVAGQWYYGLAPTTVTSTLTLAVNGLTAKPVLYNNSALATGIITSGDPMQLWYDGTSFHIILINRIATPKVVVLAPDGAVGAPAYSFAADTNTGIFRGASDELDFALGGTNYLALATTAATLVVPIRGSDGDATAPSVSFSGDTNTGLYRSAADTLAITTGGVLRWSLSTTAVTNTLPNLGPDGSASAPTFSFASDTNTGVYSVGADSLGLTVGGTVRKTISTTTETNTLLQQGADGDATTPSYSFSGDTNTGIYRVGADSLGVSIGGTVRKTLSTTTETNTLLQLGPDGAVGGPAYSFSGDADNGLYRVGANNPALAAGGSKVMDWQTAGNTQPLQPAYSAYLTADALNVTGDGTAYVLGSSVNSSEDFDQGGNHSTSGVFTAPVAGVYLFGCKVRWDGLTSSHVTGEIVLSVGITPDIYYLWNGNPYAISTGGIFMTTESKLIKLVQNQTVSFQITVSGGTKVVDIYSNNTRTFWWGYLVA